MHPMCMLQAQIEYHTISFTANCRHQILLTSARYCNDSIPKVVGYHDDLPILEGNTINFVCPPGLALTGPDSTTCTENGDWEPDPSGLKCRGNHSFFTLTLMRLGSGHDKIGVYITFIILLHGCCTFNTGLYGI